MLKLLASDKAGDFWFGLFGDNMIHSVIEVGDVKIKMRTKLNGYFKV